MFQYGKYFHLQTIAGVTMLLSVILSAILIKNHLMHYTRPRLQKYTVRIILMVPIYAVDSFISLMFPQYASVLNALREIYEAFVIYTFLNLLIAYSGGEPLLVALFLDKPTFKHPKPFDKCFSSYTPNAAFLRTCKQGILQYVFIKPTTGLIALILSFWDLYGDGEILFDKGYLYITFINNISVTVAMYYLVLFYQTTKDDLARFNPLAKFVCVKSVVFLTFWQSVTIAGLVWIGIITDVEDYPADMLATSLQDFIVCIEMFFAGIAHNYAFSYHDFVRTQQINTSDGPVYLSRFTDIVMIQDVFSDAHVNFIQPLSRRETELQHLMTPETDDEDPNVCFGSI